MLNLLARGLSPLTRGKQAASATSVGDCRFIPAHAGKTSRKTPAPASRQAHPRSHGENKAIGSSMASAWGSSPLTRGKHDGHRVDQEYDRIIPAHAGKTPISRVLGTSSRDHPRSRGENGHAWPPSR